LTTALEPFGDEIVHPQSQDEERRLKVQQGQEKKGAVGKKEDLMRATQAI